MYLDCKFKERFSRDPKIGEWKCQSKQLVTLVVIVVIGCRDRRGRRLRN